MRTYEGVLDECFHALPNAHAMAVLFRRVASTAVPVMCPADLSALVGAGRRAHGACALARNIDVTMTRVAAKSAARVACGKLPLSVRGDARWTLFRATNMTALALVAWDDMPTFIAMNNEELDALRIIGAGTDIGARALMARTYKELTT